jgi:segregation and condensation protein A
VATPYNVHVPAYEGPLDLLLDLIRKQEMDIHNIPIATITGQYLEYIHKLEEMDMDISADFIYMAATLILIKSKMLLPADPLAGPEDQGDPRAELVYRLVEHEKFKNAAQLLYQKQQIEAHVWSKPDMTLYEGETVEGELMVSLVDLVKVFQRVLERRKEVTRIELKRDEFTVGQMMQVLRDQLAVSDQGLELSEFFEACPSRLAMICALLAVLELVRLGAVQLVQGELFSGIRIRKHKAFDAVFADGSAVNAAASEDALLNAESSALKSSDNATPSGAPEGVLAVGAPSSDAPDDTSAAAGPTAGDPNGSEMTNRNQPHAAETEAASIEVAETEATNPEPTSAEGGELRQPANPPENSDEQSQ